MEGMDDECLVWSSSYVAKWALFNLTYPCSKGSEEGIYKLDSPSTFFVQAFRFGLALSLAIVILALYNSVEVLGRTIFSTASCSIHWVLFMLFFMTRSVIMVIFVPVTGAVTGNAHDLNYTLSYTLNYTGFTIAYAFQLATTFLFFVSLEHEYKFRSADVHMSTQREVAGQGCYICSRYKLFLTWPRLLLLLFMAISVILFIVMSATGTSCLGGCHCANKALVWVWLVFFLLSRVAVVLMGILLLAVRAESHRLTVNAKACLLIGLALSLLEEVPSSLLTIFPGHHCPLTYASAYDLTQFLGALSLFPLFFFVRSQYLRVEQECKLLVVWDIQKLLQVNGRRDVVF